MQETKECTKCGEVKSLEDFNKRKDSKDGYRNQCKECREKAHKKYYKENRSYIISSNQKYRVNNRGVRRASSKIRRLDPIFRYVDNKRRDLNGYLKRKSDKCYEILGCTYTEYITYLNNNKYGFIYKNSNIDIDHKITPLKAKTTEEVDKLFHFTNTHLLPERYNRNIKKDKDWDPKDLDKWMCNNKIK